ncbi:MAG TPA: ankyrin repeat domain-containing protein [Gemmatimonadales bacterium]|nr:ankyrin repeat domain-containing protein [Gemmatimonadales bacterium]
MTRRLPPHPNLEHLKNQAKVLLEQLASGDPVAHERFRSLLSRAVPPEPQLADAQLALARDYGFASWAKLKAHVEAIGADPPAELVAAIHANDASRVREVLERYPKLKSQINDTMPGLHFGATPLLAAVPFANRDLIDALLDAGADINQKSHWWAGGFGVLDDDHGLAPFLIERGATVDVHAAARLGMMDVLERLVGADAGLVHARGGDGHTPLHEARTVHVARWLLDHGADIDARDVDHESTPAQYMIRDRQDVVRFLVSRGCHTDILMAAALGDLALVRRHLEADPRCIRMYVSDEWFPKHDPRAGGHIYMWTLGQLATPHSVAREFGHEDVFQFLMERTPDELKLALACDLGDESTFRQLLAARPQLAAALSEGDRKHLVRAAQSNNTAAVRLMLAAGWPVAVRGQHGGTPLHWAAWHGNAEMVREILRYDPPIELRDTDHDGTALGWALHGSEHGWHRQTGDYPGVVDALLAAGAKLPESEVELSDAVRRVIERYGKKA